MLPILVNILQVIFIFVALLIVLLVLMQRPKNEGLGAAFGGGMTDNLFGTQTTNVLQTVTRWLGFIFFALALLLSVLYVRQSGRQSAARQQLSAPTVIPAPAPALPDPAASTLPPADGSAPAPKLEEPAPAPTPAPAPGDAAPPIPPPPLGAPNAAPGTAPPVPANPASPAPAPPK